MSDEPCLHCGSYVFGEDAVLIHYDGCMVRNGACFFCHEMKPTTLALLRQPDGWPKGTVAICADCKLRPIEVLDAIVNAGGKPAD